MPERTVALPNPSGLHARPAKVFARAAAAHAGEVTVAKDGNEVNAKSVLSVLTLDCHHGDEITIRVQGDDADTTLVALVALVESGLGEQAEDTGRGRPPAPRPFRRCAVRGRGAEA